MSCKDKNNEQIVAPTGLPFSSTLENVRTILSNPDAETVDNTAVQKGVYKISATVPFRGDTKLFETSQSRLVEQAGENKRIFFEKVEITPLGDGTGQLTAVVHVVDNPIWIPALVYGGLGILGLTGSWFVLDKVEKLTSESLLPIISIALVGLSIITTLRK